jgi:hypothetical protein
MKLNESQLRKLVRLILEEEILDEDEIEEEDEVEEASVAGMVAGVTTPLGAGPEYPKRTRRRRRKYNIYEDAAGTTTPQYQVKSGADFAGTNQHVKDFINDLAKVAHLMRIKDPVVTSGKRSINSQVRIMANNWRDAENAEKGNGLTYLKRIYKKNEKHMPGLHDIFKANLTNGKVTSSGVKKGVEHLNKNKVFISNHVYGNAIDLRAQSMSDPIVQLVKQIEKTGKYDMKLVDETGEIGKHLHVKIAGKNKNVPILKLMNNISVDFVSAGKDKTQPKGGEVLKIPGDKTWEYMFKDHWWTRKEGNKDWISLKNNKKAIEVLEKEFGKPE